MGRERAPMYLPLGSHISYLRGRMHGTRAMLAHVADISEASVRDAEQSRPSSLRTMQAIAGALNCSWTELCDPMGQQPPGIPFLELYPLFLAWEHAQCQAEDEKGDGLSRMDVDTIALDFDEGWDFLFRTVTLTRSPALHFRILMLDGPGCELRLENELPAELELHREQCEFRARRLANAAVDGLETLRNRIHANALGNPNKPVSVEVKVYDAIPTVHGMRATKQGSTRIAFTRCELIDGNPPNYEIGETCYHYYGSNEEDFEWHTAPYRTRFEELWESGRTVFEHGMA